jgi:hypothetical protein
MCICDGLQLKYCTTGRGCLDRTEGLKRIHEFSCRTLLKGGTRWRIWLMQCVTSREVAGSIRDVVIGIFH